LRGCVVLGGQAGAVTGGLDGNSTTPTLLIIPIHDRDHDGQSGGEADMGQVDTVRIGVTEIEKSVTAWIGSRNNDDIVGWSGFVPREGRGLALGEVSCSDKELSPGTESKYSEKEGSGEKSGEHHGFWALRAREGEGKG